MKVTQEDERTYKVVLSDRELEDLKGEAKDRGLTELEIMQGVFFFVFVQIVSCFWRSVILRARDTDKSKDTGKGGDTQVELGGD